MILSSLPTPRPSDRNQGASGRLADATVRALRSASPPALAQLLRSPARRVMLDAIFWHAARQLGRMRSAELESAIRCYVKSDSGADPDVYELRFKNGICRMARGAGEAKPGLTLTLDDAELVRLVSGQSTPAQGVFNGRIMVRGDMGRLAAALASVFMTRAPE